MKDQKILCLSTTDWDAQFGSRQEIMIRLSKDNEIIYVEPPRNIFNYKSFRDYNQRYENLKDAIIDKIRKINNNLYIFTPGIIVPGGINKVSGILGYKIILYLKLRKILKLHNFNDIILWIYGIPYVELINKIKAKIIIYHCTDEFRELTSLFASKKKIWEKEKKLIKLSNVIFASSKILYKKCKMYNKNVFYLPSAVDYERFSDRGNIQVQMPIDNIKNKCIIGFIGTIDNRIDFDLFDNLIKNNKDKYFVIIGPVIKEVNHLVKKIKENKNVSFLNKIKKENIPDYIRMFDICIIPYKINDYTKAISPLKLYEYFALGKPVISTALPEVKKYKNLVYIIENDYDINILIEKALNEKKEIEEKRREIAKKNSWDNRINIIKKIILSKL